MTRRDNNRKDNIKTKRNCDYISHRVIQTSLHARPTELTKPCSYFNCDVCIEIDELLEKKLLNVYFNTNHDDSY